MKYRSILKNEMSRIRRRIRRAMSSSLVKFFSTTTALLFIILGILISIDVDQDMDEEFNHDFPLAAFRSLNEVIDNDTCFFYNQLRPINKGHFPDYELVTPKVMIHSKYLFHGTVRYVVNTTKEWEMLWRSQLNDFPQFLYSGRQVVDTGLNFRTQLYQHWKRNGFNDINENNFISVNDVHKCSKILSFYPLEEYDPNIASTHKFFTKTYLSNYNVPTVETRDSYPMVLKCAELDGYDEGVFFVANHSMHEKWRRNITCLNWIQQKYIVPNPFSTADVNFYIHPNKSFSFIGVSPEVYREVGSINSKSHNRFWYSQFKDIIKNITSHVTKVSNYSGFVCFDALRDEDGEWRVVDINIRLCGGHHHFMIANQMMDRNFSFWQYFDNLQTKPGITCQEFMEIIEFLSTKTVCKAIIGSMMSKNDYCIPRFLLFGIAKDTLSECFPYDVMDWSFFDPWELTLRSDNRLLNQMIPTYLLKDFDYILYLIVKVISTFQSLFAS